MRPIELLSQYLNGQRGADDAKMQLAKYRSRKAKKVLETLTMDENFRKILHNFEPPTDAEERLVEKVVAVESWIQPSGQQGSEPSTVSWVSKLTPAFDVVGREHNIKKRRGKKAAPRSRRKRPPRTSE
jgi:hypothetical protein